MKKRIIINLALVAIIAASYLTAFERGEENEVQVKSIPKKTLQTDKSKFTSFSI